MLGHNNPNKTKESMELVSIKKLKEWKNINKTLFVEKIEINKKIDRKYYTKI